jgi:LysR family hydrogen peroxide-inducible transcriptional activator
MTLQELRYLVALADTGHFISAAQACHVGQPTLSMQLKKLENFLGVTLFERSNHGVVPTPIGKEIIEHARVAIAVVEQIRELAHQSHDPMDGSLRLGVIPTLGPYFIPRLLPALRSSFPKFHLHPREGQTAELLEGLRQHRYDALLLSLPVAARDVETMPLFHEPLMVAMPAGHALGEQSHVSREELACQQVLQLEEGHCLRKLALDVCGAPMLLDDDDELKAGSIETLRQMVAAGLGCALLPSLAVLPGMGTAHSGALQVRPLAPPVPGRTLGLVWRQHCPRAETMSTLARFIQANLPDAVEAIPRDGDAARPAGAGLTGLPFHFHPAANEAAPCITGAS